MPRARDQYISEMRERFLDPAKKVAVDNGARDNLVESEGSPGKDPDDGDSRRNTLRMVREKEEDETDGGIKMAHIDPEVGGGKKSRSLNLTS